MYCMLKAHLATFCEIITVFYSQVFVATTVCHHINRFIVDNDHNIQYFSSPWWKLSFLKNSIPIRLCETRRTKLAACTLVRPHALQKSKHHLHIGYLSNVVVKWCWHHDTQGVVTMHSSHLPSQRWINRAKNITLFDSSVDWNIVVSFGTPWSRIIKPSQ